LLTILSVTQLKAQEITFKKSGKLVAITGCIKNWQPDSQKNTVQPITRDHKGLIQKQDLPPVPIIRYRKKPVREDSGWQKIIRKPETPFSITTAIDSEIPSKNKDFSSINSADQLVFPGMNYSRINPADPSVAVGPDHIIQMINGSNGSALFSIMDKKGTTLLGPAYLDQLPGTSHNGGGDGITWYDQFSKRFVMTEFADSSSTGTSMNSLVIAVSATEDPLGAWYVYEFFADGFFPDYPKYGNFPDAWFAITRDFKNAYEGTAIWAFDKKSMLAGNSEISIIKTRLTNKVDKYNSMTPVTMAGMNHKVDDLKGYFLYYSDNELTEDAMDKDSLGLLSFKVDFSNPSSSVLNYEIGFEVSPFSSNVCETRNCAPSPYGQGYDVVSNKIMHKPYLRDFGNFQSIVLNHTVDVNGTGLAGIRWCELRKNTEWKLHQQSTFAPQQPGICRPDENRHRFIGNIIQNSRGQIALAYNFSSNKDYASLAFTGRDENDPLNKMTHEEKTIVKGTGYGTDAFRWGDYNDISPDPINDSIFWFTGMIGAGSSTWTTAVAAFKLGPKPAVDIKLSAVLYPSVCDEICENKISPVILVSNVGQTTIQNLQVKYTINNSEIKTWEWTGTLNAGSDINIQLPIISLPNGDSKFIAWIELQGGVNDQNRNNDTLFRVFNIVPPNSIPYFEGGEAGCNIPVDWKNLTTGSSHLFWQHTSVASYEGASSFLFDNFNNNEPGKHGILLSPGLNAVSADSLELSFYIAAAMYDENKIDTFEVIVVTECGQEQTTVFKKWGENLSTVNKFIRQSFVPLKNEWRRERISLNAFRNKPFSVQFKAINQFGNNFYIDAISLQSFDYPNNDLSAEKIILPQDDLCSTIIKPAIIISNKGKNNIRQATIELREGNELIETISWTGNLSLGNTDTIFAKPISTKSSMNFSCVIQSVNNFKDENSKNDTTAISFKAVQVTSLPFSENFELNSTIDRWQIIGDTAHAWKKSLAGFNSNGGLSIHNFGMPHGNSSAVSPKLTWKSADSIWLEFRLAAGYRIGFPSDTLNVDISFDCGKNWKNVFKQSGTELATKITKEPFVSTTADDWKSIRLNLSTLAFGKNEMLAKITNLSGGNNSIFIDQINIYSKDVAADLKDKGYKVLPNPVTDRLNVQFYPYAVGLSTVKLTDAKGRIKFFRKYDRDSNIHQQLIDFSQLSAGIYFITLQYRDRTITEKIIKLNP
jgi:hypothetical protein